MSNDIKNRRNKTKQKILICPNLFRNGSEFWRQSLRKSRNIHCVKSVHIRSYPGPHFPTFGLNTERINNPEYGHFSRSDLYKANINYI